MNLRVVIAAALALGAMAAPAHADANLDQAKAKFDEGQIAFVAKDFAKAAQSFVDAYGLRSDITAMLYNAAVAYEEHGKVMVVSGKGADAIAAYDEAIKHYNLYVTKVPDDPANPDTTKRAAALATEVATLRANPPTAASEVSKELVDLGVAPVIRGVYVIESNPSAAKIYLNGSDKPFASTPWSGVLEGKPELVLKLEGYIPNTSILPTSPSGIVVKSIDLARCGELGYLTIRSNVPGANIYLGDKASGVRGQTPTMLDLPGGRYKVIIAADGYEDYVQEIDLTNCATPEIVATMSGAPVGYLNMRGDGIEESRVYIDGELACDPGPCRKPLSEGSHTVRVTRPGHKPYGRTFEINPKTETQVKVELAKKPFKWDAVLAYGLTAAFAGGGVYLGLEAQKLHDELQDEIDAGNPPVDENDSRFNRGKLFAIAADALYAAAGISLLTAVYYTFREKGPPSRGIVDTKATSMRPVVGAQYAGVDMVVSW